MLAYQLLDFGSGRRLERFGPWVIDRPCPAAEHFAPAQPAAWHDAEARFERTSAESGQWTFRRELPDRWTIDAGPFRLELKPSPFGHLGVFPEQAANWEWIAEQMKKVGPGTRDTPFSVLHLFAYTGASTLAAAAAGAEVVHVDAARNTVAWARRNAELSGLADAPIHWVVEDARKFVRREVRRGNRYDAVILDPPSYGHGRRGEVWRLARDLPPLLSGCAELTSGRRGFILLTAHTPDFDAPRLEQMLAEALAVPVAHGGFESSVMTLCTADRRELPSGGVVRLTRK